MMIVLNCPSTRYRLQRRDGIILEFNIFNQIEYEYAAGPNLDTQYLF